MNADRSSEPRYTIVISKNGKQLGTLRDRDTSQAKSSFGGAVARYKNSADNHRIEFYDGQELIEAWSTEEGYQAPPA
ncbi:hypothetical protein, partial [Methylocystis sp. SB2]|uniref:hypothetical protein n=1 Tax=Methylocystis sp. (strain SB2) TaxID=743836 RepID=UPI00040FCB20